MKNCCFILSFLALCVIAGAQHFTQYYVYRPGYGERQFGLSLGPSFSAQHLVFTASEKINYKYYYIKLRGQSAHYLMLEALSGLLKPSGTRGLPGHGLKTEGRNLVKISREQ